MRKDNYNIPIYFGILQVVVNKSFHEAIKGYNFPQNSNTDDYDAFVLENSNKKDTYRVSVFIKPDVTPSVVAHEALHIMNRIMHRVEAIPTWSNDEPQAYLIGWIVEQIYKTLEKCKKSTTTC